MIKKETRAEKNIRWCETFLRIPEGKFVGQPLKMAEFMKEDFYAIYDNPRGLTRRAIISRARKNAKSSETAMILLLHLCGPEAKRNSQLYSAAQSREQASILFSLAAKMVRMSPSLNEVVTIRDTAKQLFCPKLGSLYRALSADASTAYGLSPALIIHDELGQVRGPKSDLYDALETATAAQENPLSIVISTQAPNANDLLSVLIDDALKGEDPRTVLRFNYAPAELDTFSDEAIEAANPAFHIFMVKDEVLDMREQAKRMPTRQAEFENLVLNRRVETKAPFITAPVWKRCGGVVVDTFTKSVYGGLDLSSVSDLTAKVYISPEIEKNEENKDVTIWHVKPEFWLPGEGIIQKSREDKVPYDTWYEDQYLNLVTGARTIEYEFVAETIFQDMKYMNIRKIAFDKYNWKHFKPWLRKVGFKAEEVDEKNPDGLFVEFGQNFSNISPALRSFESAVLNERIRHGNHPLLAWCVSNAVVIPDDLGNRKLIKGKKANGKIDGLLALLMAHAIAETLEEKPKPKPRLLFI